MTLLNYWHYITFAIILILFIGSIVGAFKQPNKKLLVPMLISSTIVALFFAVFSVVVIDKYTKVVSLYKLKNKRLLSTEQIIYTGIVKNEGSHKIGKVTFEIKLVNNGFSTGKVQGGNFYKVSGFFDFFTGYGVDRSKPQTITKEFVVATNLKPGAAKSFRVHFRYPAYFRSVSDFAEVSGH